MYFEVKHLILHYCKVRFFKCSQVSTLKVHIQVYFFFHKGLNQVKNLTAKLGFGYLKNIVLYIPLEWLKLLIHLKSSFNEKYRQ